MDRDMEDQLGQAAIVANLRHLDYVCLISVSGLDAGKFKSRVRRDREGR